MSRNNSKFKPFTGGRFMVKTATPVLSFTSTVVNFPADAEDIQRRSVSGLQSNLVNDLVAADCIFVTESTKYKIWTLIIPLR
ncbi:hypothetical protein CVS40_9239 [Lucilia cuprina]|nr:hypothetical protein CVS40_9239 [Lucilia cuprina]